MSDIQHVDTIDIKPIDYSGLPEPISSSESMQRLEVVRETAATIKALSTDKKTGELKSYKEGGMLVKLDGIDKPFLTESGVMFVLQRHRLMVGPDEKEEIEMEPETTIDGQEIKGHMRYRTKIAVLNADTGELVYVLRGQANTKESKNRIRGKARKCPSCGKIAIKESKFGGGWYCFPKPFGGCGLTFKEKDDRITGQEELNAENDSPYDLYDTTEEMSVIRALRKGPKRLGYAGYFAVEENIDYSNVREVGISKPKTKPKSPAPPAKTNDTVTPEEIDAFWKEVVKNCGDEPGGSIWLEAQTKELFAINNVDRAPLTNPDEIAGRAFFNDLLERLETLKSA